MDTRPEINAGSQVVADDATPAKAMRRGSLSSKLLLLTVLFVMLAEIFIFVPSLAFFRLNWLIDRLNLAQVAVLVAEAAPDGDLPEMLRTELLNSAQVRMVALKRSNQRRLILSEPMEAAAVLTYDLRGDSRTTSIRRSPGHLYELIRDAVAVFFLDGQTLMRIVGQPGMGAGEVIEMVLPLAPLRQSMVQHALNVLGLSIVISLLTAGAVYLTLNRLLVAPLMRLTDAMVEFSGHPEDATRIIVPSKRSDEVGLAEEQLAHMQTELHNTLAQKSRLAALGLAVSKINHDLRNLLANAQLLSDRLTSLPDPQVQRFAPKLIASLDRAIKFCNESLQFGRAAEPPPRREKFGLRALALEVGDGLDLPRADVIDYRVEVDERLSVDADRDQLFRVLSNLVRNAVDALSALEDGQQSITISANRGNGIVEIHLVDTGPGLPRQARLNLFQPFQGSTRRGGTGLGLAIAQEIVAAHGGQISLVDDRPGDGKGAHFRIALPDRHS